MSQGKRFLAPYVLVNNVAMAGAFQSSPFSIALFDRATVEMLFTGTLTGTVVIQVSNDNQASPAYLNPAENPPNWYPIPLGLNPLSGGGDNYFIDFTETGMPWIRISVNITGGVGNLIAVVTGKES